MSTTGGKTYNFLIKNMKINFYTSQALSEHVKFQSYLFMFNLVHSSFCTLRSTGVTDDVNYFLFDYRVFFDICTSCNLVPFRSCLIFNKKNQTGFLEYANRARHFKFTLPHP